MMGEGTPFDPLPPIGHELHNVCVLRKDHYITFIVFHRFSGEKACVFTLHEREAKDLAERVLEAMTFKDGEYASVEGAYVGGPPRKDQVVG